jgi:hypothetical protein
MSGDYIKVVKSSEKNEYVIQIYFEFVDGTINIQLTEENFIRFLSKSISIINKTSDSFTLKVPDELEYLLKEQNQNEFKEVVNKIRAVNKKNIPRAEVTIYIPDYFVSLRDAEIITNACGDFMETLGFEMHAEDEPVLGSFFKKIWFLFSKTISEKELEGLYNRAENALDKGHSDALGEVEQTEILANSAAKLINSLDNVNEGIIRCGILIVIKRMIKGENSQITVHQLSPEMVRIIDQKPQLLLSINTIYELLTGDITNSLGNQDGEQLIA